MSQWTHVAGCIRIDKLGGSDSEIIHELTEKLGRTCEFDSSHETWEACNVPRGSEGSLQYSIGVTGEENSTDLDWGMVVIWGDLRDYDNVEEIFQWIKKACSGEIIRGCAVKVDIEYQKSYFIFDAGDDLEKDELIMKEI